MPNVEIERRHTPDKEHELILEILARIEAEQLEIKMSLLSRQHLDEKINSLDKAINGNGKAGLKEEVVNIKNDMQSIRQDVMKMFWAAGVAMAAVIGQAVLRIFGQ